jgi:hypothetical protein
MEISSYQLAAAARSSATDVRHPSDCNIADIRVIRNGIEDANVHTIRAFNDQRWTIDGSVSGSHVL